MTRSIIRRVDWTCVSEPSSPHPIHAFECTTCGETGQANDLFERARDFVFEHVGRNPSHTGYRETVTRHWRMHGQDVAQAPALVDQAPERGWVVKPETLAYAEELRANPGKASRDGHTGWQCDAGASLIVGAETPGPGKLGTHHGAIYACTGHQAAAVERITAGGYDADVRPAPAGHRWSPWPCGHVTAYNPGALAALVDEPAARSGAAPCPECDGRGARVLPGASGETECGACEGTGRDAVPLGPECLSCHDAGCADCGRVSLPSTPTPEYGAPYVPVYGTAPRDYTVPVQPSHLGPVDSGTPDRTERY